MKYILFDLDGTLTDPKEGITNCVQYSLRSLGVEPPPNDELTCFIGPPLIDSYMTFCGMDREQAERATEKYRERFATVGLFENRAFDGIADALAALRRKGSILAVATSKPEVFARRILDKYDLSQYFSVVVGSNLDGTLTDKAEVIAETLRRLDIPDGEKSGVLMIGDRRHDIIGAKKNGVAAAGVRFGYAEPNELEDAGADVIFDTVADIVRAADL